ncbi:MAG: Ig-like domain-containing protein [Candidatus Sabulitectum sp.]|nr:Ig-like domain-containing protein [Candidatus Sabulitectum sp.]
MRKLSALLLLVAVSFAVDSIADLAPDDFSSTSSSYLAPTPLSKAILFDQAYNGTIVNARNYNGYWHMADDFSLTNPSRLESIEWWSLFMSGTSTMDIRVHEDNGGLPGTVLWEQLCVTATVTDTGDDFFGYDINHVEVVLAPADYCFLSDGTTYWLSLHHNGTGAWLCRWDGGIAAESYNSGNSWTSPLITFMLRLNGTEDLATPEVSGQVPADGATGVPVTSDIVFHVTDDCFGVDTSTIAFSVEDGAKSNETSSSLTRIAHTGAIAGTLVVDDTDPNDVICTFTPDSDLPLDTITCTVAAGLADDYGRATTTDIVWSFDTVVTSLEKTTWGQIKAL